MYKIIRLLIAALLTVIVAAPAAEAKEYGSNRSQKEYRYVVSDGQKLNVRAQPSTSGALLTQLKPGDVVYLEADTTFRQNGYEWVTIVDEWNSKNSSFAVEGYVTNIHRLIPEANPDYKPVPAEVYIPEATIEHSQTVAKWILLGLTILLIIAGWIFVSFVLFHDDGGLLLDENHHILRDENGKALRREAEGFLMFGRRKNGMKRTFFFCPEPYIYVIELCVMIVLAAVVSILVMLALGGTVFVLLWIVKILCYVLMWVGIISCIIGIIACICGAWGAIIAVIIGGIIWAYDDEITGFGDYCAEKGLAFFNEFNILSFSWDLVVEYWRPALLIAATPIALLLALAILWMIFAGSLMLIERIVTSRYNIKHPCPHCQRPSEPAIYLSRTDEGYEPLPNNIKLRPGVYGLFHITHPKSKERMPTMLLNGRDRLARECGNCHKRIRAEEGTELHIALAGSPQSGKSTLTYRMLAEIIRRVGNKRADFTDVKQTVKDETMPDKVRRIATEGCISPENMPAKTAVDDVASTQMIIKRQHLPVPYRLFINDVAGEVFDSKNSQVTADATRFFGNVNSILFIIDPITTNLSDGEGFDTSFKDWLDKHDDKSVVKLDVKAMKDSIINQLKAHNRDPKQVHMNLVLVKKDLGYIKRDVDINSQEDLRVFFDEVLGQHDLLHWGNQFASLTLLAVSSVAKDNESNINSLVDSVIIKQLDISL